MVMKPEIVQEILEYQFEQLIKEEKEKYTQELYLECWFCGNHFPESMIEHELSSNVLGRNVLCHVATRYVSPDALLHKRRYPHPQEVHKYQIYTPVKFKDDLYISVIPEDMRCNLFDREWRFECERCVAFAAGFHMAVFTSIPPDINSIPPQFMLNQQHSVEVSRLEVDRTKRVYAWYEYGKPEMYYVGKGEPGRAEANHGNQLCQRIRDWLAGKGRVQELVSGLTDAQAKELESNLIKILQPVGNVNGNYRYKKP